MPHRQAATAPCSVLPVNCTPFAWPQLPPNTSRLTIKTMPRDVRDTDCRVYTVIVYLNGLDAEQGGKTELQLANRSVVQIQPEVGVVGYRGWGWGWQGCWQ